MIKPLKRRTTPIALKRYMSAAAAIYMQRSIFRWQTIMIIGFLFLWEGLPFTLIGMTNVIGYQVYAVLVSALSILFLFKKAISKERITFWEVIPLLLFAYACLCSFVYSTLIKPQPAQAWMLAVYTVCPLLTIFALKFIRATSGDCINALMLAGFFGSVLVIVVTLSGSDLLNFYIRGSAFGSERRIVFFKLEAAFCVVISAIMLLNYSSISRYLMSLTFFIVSSYNLFALTESRLAIVSFFISFFLCWLFIFRAKRKVITLAIAPLALVPISIYLIDRFLKNFQSLDKYLASDSSAIWRNITIKEFSNYFYQTNGLGFGFMSGNPKFNNVISYTSNYGGIPYRLPNYGLYLDDIGIYSSLYQYGYIGLAFVLTMTAMCVIRLGSSYRISRSYEPVCACGFMMISFMISPVSMNYFTLFYTAHIGGILWYLASRIDREYLLMRSTFFATNGREG